MKFTTFWKPRRVSFSSYDWNYCIRKRCLLKRLKALASAHHSVINVLTGSKHCRSQHGTTIFLIFSWIRDKLSWKMSALVTSEIFRLFLNTLTPDDKYSRRNMQIFWQQLPTPLSQEENTFCQFLIAFLKCAWSLEHSDKKRTISLPNYYGSYIIRKRCLLKRLKGLASAHHSVINVLTGSKHCWRKNGITIFLFFHEFEINWVGKCLN